MATLAPSPAWELRARAVTRARVAVPAGLGALVLLSLLLRSQVLGVGFWIDEGLSVGIADRPLAEIFDALRLDGSPPLYYLLLHFWMEVAGTSEAAVRALSLACALAAVPAAWWAGRLLFGTRAGWMAAVLTATNPFLTLYAQEARMYALAALLALVAVAAFARAFAEDEHDRRWAAVFAVALAALLYTHNWGLFLGASCAVACAVLIRTAPPARRRELLLAAVIGFGGAALLYLPQLPTTLYQAAHTGAPWAEKPSLLSLLGTPGRMLGEHAQIALLIAAGAGLAALAAVRAPARRAAACLLVLAVLTVVLAWLASQVSPAWANRYLAVAVPPLILLAAAGLANAGRVGVAGVIVAGALAAGNVPPDDKSNVRDVAEAVAPSLRPGDLVVSTQPEQVPVLAYYLPDGLRYATLTGALADTGVTDWRDGPERLAATSAERDLAPLLDALPAGRRLVLVEPLFFDIRRWRAPWTELVRMRTEEWRQHISNDGRFLMTSIEPPPPPEVRPMPVQAIVYVKARA